MFDAWTLATAVLSNNKNQAPHGDGWVYLKRDNESALVDGEEVKLPPKGTVFLAFDTFRWKVQIGIRESGGYMSLMLPEICDDCSISAWAPLGVATMPNESVIRANTDPNWHEAINSNYASDGLTLLMQGKDV